MRTGRVSGRQISREILTLWEHTFKIISTWFPIKIRYVVWWPREENYRLTDLGNIHLARSFFCPKNSVFVMIPRLRKSSRLSIFCMAVWRECPLCLDAISSRTIKVVLLDLWISVNLPCFSGVCSCLSLVVNANVGSISGDFPKRIFTRSVHTHAEHTKLHWGSILNKLVALKYGHCFIQVL